MPFPRSSLKEHDSKESEMERCLETLSSEVLCQVWDNVFGPELLLALQKSADDFAVWRAKSPQRLLGFWLPTSAEARTAPEVAGRKLQELLGRKDLDIEWWCRTQVPSLGAHFHYDTHPFLNEAHGNLRPEFSSVLFLSDVGGPTVVLNQQAQGCGHRPPVPHNGSAVASRTNRWFAFPGTLRHGAVALTNSAEEMHGGGRRSVILYNFWPRNTPKTAECVQPNFSNYQPFCAWAPTARHILCKPCLKQLQDEPMNAEKVASVDLNQPKEMDHSVPMEGTPGFLPMPCTHVFKMTSGFMNFHWRTAALLYLSDKRHLDLSVLPLPCRSVRLCLMEFHSFQRMSMMMLDFFSLTDLAIACLIACAEALGLECIAAADAFHTVWRGAGVRWR